MHSDSLKELVNRYPEMRDEIERAQQSRDSDFEDLCEDLAEISRRVESARANANPNLEELLTLHRELEREWMQMVLSLSTVN